MAEPQKLVLPKDVVARARRTVDRHLKSWLFGASVDALTIRLGSPSEAAVAAQRAVVQRGARGVVMAGADGRVFPDRRQHRVQREGDEHRDQHRRHDGQADLLAYPLALQAPVLCDAGAASTGCAAWHAGQRQHVGLACAYRSSEGLPLRNKHLHHCHDLSPRGRRTRLTSRHLPL